MTAEVEKELAHISLRIGRCGLEITPTGRCRSE